MTTRKSSKKDWTTPTVDNQLAPDWRYHTVRERMVACILYLQVTGIVKTNEAMGFVEKLPK